MTQEKHYPDANQNLDFAKLEEDILNFWQQEKIFEKSVEIRNFSNLDEDITSPVQEPCALKDHASCRHNLEEEKSEFVFYDGPPFANGLPHYGHLLTGFIKDIFARYQTMKGKKVERKFGWDTHGLPVEMETEKELGVSGQIAIQEYGIEKFNLACEKSVMKYAKEWKEYVGRQGRWVDFDNGYKTMDIKYMESVIWAFKQLYSKGLLYEDYRVMPYSWACQTPVSNFETRMDNAYRQKASKAVTVKFELLDPIFNTTSKVSLLAWTTTPWTLPSNLGLAVGKNIEYVLIACHPREGGDSEILILASALLEKFSKDLGSFETLTTVKGQDLIGAKIKPLFPYFINHEKITNSPKAFSIMHGDFVTTEEGTGIVHMAPGFGEDDQALCKANGIPTICPVDEGGKFTSEIFDIFEITPSRERELDPVLSLKGRQVFETNDDIIKYLKAQGSWIKTEQYLHNYPHCWRTDTPLIYKAVSSWYVKVTDFKDRMVELNGGTKFNPAKVPSFIETARLKGKVASMSDFADLAKLYSDPEVRKYYYFMNPYILSEQQTLQAIDFYQELYQEGFPRFVFHEKETGKFIGTGGLCFYDPREENFENGRVEISYQLAKEFWGKGYATEVAKELIEFAFKRYPIKTLCVATVSDNLGSQKVIEKCGFELKFKRKNQYPKADRNANYEEYYYELTRENGEYFKNATQGINWIPDHVKDGQFGKWLEGARDWSITRNRFWGCPVPVWVSDDPQYPRIDVYGSLDELERDFGVRPTNLHRPFIDQLTRQNPNDPTGKSKMRRVTDVLDCWFESGSMPYAQVHYPFENKEWFENNFPADFITEYMAQTRGWFYTLMVLSTALFDRAPFKNVICHGTILDEKSQKLSKRLKNYADPLEVFSSLGSDAMRFYMISQPVMRGQELRIDKEGKAIRDSLRLSIKPLINAFNFFCLYANADGIKANRIDYNREFKNNLDKYILSKLKVTVEKIDFAMTNYDTVIACEEFNQFFEALNNWYIRRSRSRFWKSEIDQDKQEAYDVLYTVLLTMCEAAAPLLPFTTEFVWKSLN